METTLIGSLPYLEAEVAVEKSLNCVTIPCWPQLPKRSFKEHMCPQYSEGFPGIIVDEVSQKIFVDEDNLYQELEMFYQNYLDKNVDYFAISEQYATGFYKFLEVIRPNKFINKIKLQTVGPLTFGLAVKTKSGQPLFYNEQYRDIINKHISMKSLWQIKSITEVVGENISVVLFYDEPYLAAYGSAFTAVSKEEIINSISTTISETKTLVEDKIGKIELHIGIHCCANTDWSILTSIDKLDIISFDTYDYFDTFLLYKNEVKQFIDRGGKIAWGIIPNDKRIMNTGNTISNFIENNKELIQKLEEFGNYIFQQKSIEACKTVLEKFEFLLRDGFVTPQCGLGNASLEITEKVLEICKMFSIK